MPTGGLAAGWPIARLFGITIRVHVSWLLIFFLLTWSLAETVLPLSNLAGGGPFWQGFPAARDLAELMQGQGLSREAAAQRLGIALWPVWQYWVLGAVGAVGLFLCVLAHELSHSLVAKASGIAVEGITLFLFGGVSRIRDDTVSPIVELKVAAAGPLMSILLGGVFGVLFYAAEGWAPGQARALLFYFAFVNILLAMFNLLPGFPLDGGRLLRAGLWAWLGDLRRATYIASRVGRFVAGMLIFIGAWDVVTGLVFPNASVGLGSLWWIIIGLFLWHAAGASYQQVALRQAFEGLTLGDAIQDEVVTVPPDLTLERAVDEYFYKYRFRSFPVLDGDRFVGMLGLVDLQGVPRDRWAAVRVREAMHQVSPDNLVCPDEDLAGVFRKMMQEDKGHLPVVDGGRLVGIVTRHDIMTLLQLNTDLGGRHAG
jgi:Zn-dependent protease